MIKGAIFDMDGTILDSMPVWKNMTRKFLSEKNLAVTEKQLAEFRDMTLDESMPVIKKTYNLDESPEELKKQFNRLGYNEYMYNIPAKPFVKEYITKLKREGTKIAIATSGFKELCEVAMRRLGLWDMIDEIVISQEVGVNKSNPDIYLLAADRIGVPPAECVVFEDILMGLKGAKLAGMKTVAVFDQTSESDKDEIKKIADRYILGWDELL